MECSPPTWCAWHLPMRSVGDIFAASTVVLGLVPAPVAAAVEPTAAGDPPLVYPACPQGGCGLFVRDPDGGERQLTDGDGDQAPAWSPDGREVAFARPDAGLFAVGASAPASGS